MNCPFCHIDDTKVVDSRQQNSGQAVRRRRACEKCGKRFTTYEKIEWNLPVVSKRDGRREPFAREKILQGLSKACEKRVIATEQLERIVENLERELLENGPGEIMAETIGIKVMEYLKNLDHVAYVRFASVYIDFENVEDFIKDLRTADDAASVKELE